MRQGDVLLIPANVKHWHGAAPATTMTHIAILEPSNGKSTTWLEKVSAVQYSAPVAISPVASRIETRPTAQIKSIFSGDANISQEPTKELTPAQKAIGDYSPKMVELTDQVLFGDIWERPGLSKRDRSMVTVTALITGGNTEQLPGHLARAKENGVTEDEIVEVITHLAFYTGWPKAMSAIQVAKKVFGK